MLRSLLWLATLLAIPTVAFAQTPESEPNNTPATANPAVRGSRIAGRVDFGGPDDVDYWVIAANAGDTIYADVDASEFGTGPQTAIALYASDGTTQVAVGPLFDGLDPQLKYVATTTGNYYLRIEAVFGGGPYIINLFPVTCPVAEDHEPNDTAATAQSISSGAVIHGISCPTGDPDWYKFTAQAGQTVTILMDNLRTDPTPPYGCACSMYGWMRLYGSDGSSLITQTYEHNWTSGISYKVETSGTYYVRATVWPGGLKYRYTLHFEGSGAGGGGGNGPGDPPTVRAEGIGTALVAVISDPLGDFIVADRDANRVVWVAPDGRKQVISQDVPGPEALGWDIFANLLIVGFHGVYKLNPQGHVTQLITSDDLADIALAPDGTIWVTDRRSMIHHYDPLGHLIADISINNPTYSGPNVIAIGPSGDVFYTQNDAARATTVYKLSGGTGQAVFSTTWYASDIAIDANGNFYLTNPAATGTDAGVYRYSPFGAPLDIPLAGQLNQPTGITFGRNADGTMNNRLFVTELGGRLLELNNAATPTPGAPIAFATQAQVIADLLKPGPLTDAQRRVLDAIGNKNGRYDVGDLRAFLLNNNTLSASHAH